MGFECGIELAKRNSNEKGLALYYFGRLDNYLDTKLINISEAAEQDNDCLYIIDIQKLRTLIKDLSKVYDITKKYSDRVMTEFDNFAAGYEEHMPQEFTKADLSALKDAAYNLSAELTDIVGIHRIYPVLSFICESELFDTFIDLEFWQDNTDLVLRYWRSY